MIDPNYWYHLSNGFAGDHSVLTREGNQLAMRPLGSRGQNPDQLWRLEPVVRLPDGWYRIYSQALPTDSCLDSGTTSLSMVARLF